MRWWLRPSVPRSRCSYTPYPASGNCRTSSIPLSPPTAVGCPATDPTAPNTPLSVDDASEEVIKNCELVHSTGDLAHSPEYLERSSLKRIPSSVCMFLHEDLLLRGNYVHERGGAMPASIYRTSEGRAEILWLYDEALSHLRIGHESKMVSTRYGETHVLSLGPEDAPPVLFLHGGNFLNPTCLRWFLPLTQRYRIHSPDIVGQPGKSGQLRPSPNGDGHAWWVEDVLDGLGLKRVPFVGLSYGAGIALRTAGYAPERVSAMVVVSPAGIATGLSVPMLIETVVPMMAYHLRPSRPRLLRAARRILTEHDELATRQLGAIYRHVKLDTQLPRMATEGELRGFS